jgi:hypothetical protein
LGSKGGGKRRKQTLKRNRRGKRGGGGFLEFGGFPQLIENAWNNTLNGAKNMVNGYNGVKLLPPPSPWRQPALEKGYTAPPFRPTAQFLALTRTS